MQSRSTRSIITDNLKSKYADISVNVISLRYSVQLSSSLDYSEIIQYHLKLDWLYCWCIMEICERVDTMSELKEWRVRRSGYARYPDQTKLVPYLDTGRNAASLKRLWMIIPINRPAPPTLLTYIHNACAEHSSLWLGFCFRAFVKVIIICDGYNLEICSKTNWVP